MHKIIRKRYLIRPVMTAIVILGVYYGISLKFPIFSSLKLKAGDFYTRISYALKPKDKAAKNIAILSIDNTAYDWFGKKWPWDRKIFAELVYRLIEFRPKVIGLNLAFIGASKNTAIDELLAHSLSVAGNVIIASYFDDKGRYHAPLEILAEASGGFGFTNKPAANDGVIRHTRVFTRTVQDIILDYSFELKAAYLFRGISLDNIDHHEWNIPVSAGGAMPLNYAAQLEDFLIIPIMDILNKKAQPDILKDKILIIGMTGEAFRDMQKTPLGVLPGAAIIANNILMFLRGNYIKQMPWLVNLTLIILASIFFGIHSYKSSAGRGLISLIIILLSFFIISIFLRLINIEWDNLSIPFLMPALYIFNNSYKNLSLFIENYMLKRKLIRDPATGFASGGFFGLKLKKKLYRGDTFEVAYIKIANYNPQQLKRFSCLLKKNSRKTRKVDFISRYSEDTFYIIIDGNAAGYCERIKNILDKEKIQITAGTLEPKMIKI